MNKFRITYPNNKEVRDDTSRTTKMKVNILILLMLFSLSTLSQNRRYYSQKDSNNYYAEIIIDKNNQYIFNIKGLIKPKNEALINKKDSKNNDKNSQEVIVDVKYFTINYIAKIFVGVAEMSFNSALLFVFNFAFLYLVIITLLASSLIVSFLFVIET